LIKGLLTKDDEKRWGKEQVDRWMSGERDIPVFYETPSASETRGVQPFRFCGSDFYTKESLARAFAAHEEPWNTPSDHLRFIRLWLESNLEFDEARYIGGAIAGNDPEIALFRFIHSNAEIPFGVYGHIVNLDNLYIFLWRAVRKEATEAERRIARILEDGKVSSFYGEYANLRETDGAFGELLELLKGEPPARQLGYVAAMRDPGTHLWPGDADAETASGRIECMRRILSAPLKHDAADEIKSLYAVPGSLWAMLESNDAYASGVDKLNRWRTQGLFFPKGPDDEAYRNLSVEGYERMAKVRLWGHTAAVLKKLDEVERAVSEIHSERPTPVFFAVSKELEFARDRKITHRDRSFFDTLCSLVSERRAMKGDRWKNCAIYGIAGTAFLGAGRAVLGLITGWSDRRWSFVGFALLMLIIFFLLGKLGILKEAMDDFTEAIENENRPMIRGWARGFPTAISSGVVMYFVLLILAFPLANLSVRVTNVLGYGFPLLGAPFGAMISNALHKRGMGRNTAEIIDACEIYVRRSFGDHF
jgi:hypothetical protein